MGCVPPAAPNHASMNAAHGTVREIFLQAVQAVEPRAAVHAHCRVAEGALWVAGQRFPLAAGGRIVVVGAGKASAALALAVEDLLEERISGGVVVVKYGHGAQLRRVRLLEAGHPVPDSAGQAAAAALMHALDRLGARDLVIACWSGGASALTPSPLPGLTLADKQEVTRLLLGSGADIAAVNTVRKHLSQLKGGQLARRSAPAAVVCLAISDVVGDDLATIGSGPFYPDHSTFADALALVDRHDLRDALPAAARAALVRGAAGGLSETPKPGDPCFARVHHHIVASNRQALAAAAAAAQARGFRPLLIDAPQVGAAHAAGAALVAQARLLQAGGGRVCLIAGGETTVTLGPAPGRGGRNQELALSAALALDGVAGITVLAGGSDGNDGPTDAAGAISDGTTVMRAHARGLAAARHLAGHDAYPLFAALGDLLITGATGTNVMDLTLALIAPG
jgi:glycerate 2-kinase